MPRPPIQHHRFFIEIEAETQEFLSSMVDKWLAGKAIRAGGEVLKGALSHPIGVGVIAAVATAVALKLGLVDKNKTEDVLIVAAGFPPELAGAFTTTHKILRMFFPFLPPLP